MASHGLTWLQLVRRCTLGSNAASVFTENRYKRGTKRLQMMTLSSFIMSIDSYVDKQRKIKGILLRGGGQHALIQSTIPVVFGVMRKVGRQQLGHVVDVQVFPSRVPLGLSKSTIGKTTSWWLNIGSIHVWYIHRTLGYMWLIFYGKSYLSWWFPQD